MIKKHWSFSPVDTWFFRESRPYDSIGGTQLNSLFPPSARTVAGAVRRFIGEQVDIDWQAFEKGDGTKHTLSPIDLCEQIGDANQLGNCVWRTLFIIREKTPLSGTLNRFRRHNQG